MIVYGQFRKCWRGTNEPYLREIRPIGFYYFSESRCFMDTSAGYEQAQISDSQAMLDGDDPIPALSKRYFSIGEVSRLTGLRTMTIRYWEKRYPILRVHARQHGDRRRYRPSEFLVIILLNELISVLGMTSDGASAILDKVDLVPFVLSKQRSNEDFVTRHEIRNILCHAFVQSLSHVNPGREAVCDESEQLAFVS